LLEEITAMNVRNLTAVATLLGCLLGAGPALAATPLNNPKGLAVDGNGNLYVANPTRNASEGFPSGQVLVYNKNSVQTNVIGAGVVSYPTGVAVDSRGSIFVANLGDFTIKAFKPNGQAIPAKTLDNPHNHIQSPSHIAIDGMDNLWVNSGDHLSMYAADNTLLNTYTPPDYLNAIALRGPILAEARSGEIDFLGSGNVLTNHIVNVTFLGGKAAEALTVDAAGKIYFGTFTGEIGVYDTVTNVAYDIASVAYGPSGMAVDKANNRLYVASDDLNKIDVFSLTGTYLTTLH
jgi:sugar lactone lactonase YvrE